MTENTNARPPCLVCGCQPGKVCYRGCGASVLPAICLMCARWPEISWHALNFLDMAPEEMQTPENMALLHAAAMIAAEGWSVDVWRGLNHQYQERWSPEEAAEIGLAAYRLYQPFHAAKMESREVPR